MERTVHSLDTTISHSSHATDYDCDYTCKPVGDFAMCTTSIHEWEHSTDKSPEEPVVTRGRYETAHVVSNTKKLNKKQQTAVAIAVVVFLLNLLVIAVAEVTQAARCRSGS